jgi:small subunit ribosomal protein S6e
MEFKVVVSDPQSGKSYQREVKDDKAPRLVNLKVGDEFDGGLVGLPGYGLKITGGSDKAGFPMKKGIQGIKRSMVMMTEGVGYNPVEAVRRRKRVRGEMVAEDIVQINTLIAKRGPKAVEELFPPAAKAEGAPADEKKEAKK